MQHPDPDQWNPSIQKPPPAPSAPPKQSFWKIKIGCVPLWLLLGIIGLFVLISLINGITTGGRGIGNSPTSTPSASATPTPTDTPIPTQALTAKPQPKSLNQQINDAVQGAGMVGKNIKTSYSTDSKLVTVHDDIGDGNLTNGLTVQEMKLECFTAQKALWTSAVSSKISEVDMSISMNVVDQYGNKSNSDVGSCDLQKSTEQQFNWSNLDDDMAWGDYDNTFIAPFLTQ